MLVLRCTFIPICALILAVQLFATYYRFHPSLGLHWQLFSLYPPWRLYSWWAWWGWHVTWPVFVSWLGLSIIGLLLTWQSKPAKKDSAQWATGAMLRRSGLLQGDGVVLGKCRGKVVRSTGPEHVLCVAPTQSGKTRALVVPTLLEWRDSALVHDPKDELYDLTALWCRRFSHVVRFRPTEADTAQYNPLQSIRWGAQEAIRDCIVLAEMQADPDGTARLHENATSKHFRELMEIFFCGLYHYGWYSRAGLTMAALHAQVNLQPFNQLIGHMRRFQRIPAIAQAVIAAEELADREGSGLISTCRRALALYLDPYIAHATAISGFQLSDLRYSLIPTTLYLSIPFGDQDRLRPLSRILVRQMLDVSTQELAYVQRLLLALDEAPSFGYLSALDTAPDYLAGYGLTLLLITPSLNRLAKIYGEHHTFLEGCKYRVIFGLNDDRPAERFSRMTGQQTIARQRKTVSGPWYRRQTAVSTDLGDEPLLSSTALMQMDRDEVLLLVGNQAPVRLQKAWYFRDRHWRKMVDYRQEEKEGRG